MASATTDNAGGPARSPGPAGRPARADQADWSALWWWARDGVRLHARDHAPPASAGAGDAGGAAPILLVPGPATTARAYERVAPGLAGLGHRVVAVDLRGRGDSGFAPDALSYAPLGYAQDLIALLDATAMTRAVVVGSSLSGAAALLLAAQAPERVAGLVLVDIAPAPDPAAVARVAAMLGAQAPQPTWMHAARAVEDQLAREHPGHDIHDWLRTVRRMRRLSPEGRIVADHDPAVAVPWRGAAAGAALVRVAMGDGARAFDLNAARGLPMLLVRGALSDMVDEAAVDAMRRQAPSLEVLTVPGVGHAPTLEEEGVAEAIARFAGACR